MTRRILFYVQHLLGIGHLRRAATLTRALQRAGFETSLISGGHEIPNLDLGGARFIQLDPTRALDESFKVLVRADGSMVDEDWKAARRQQLIEVLRQVRPHILMFELFPFGRRQMRFELLPMLQAAASAPDRPLIVSSVRDILVGQAKPEREAEMLDLVQRYFDRVLVHGDPGFIPFDRTFPPARQIADKIAYTGYVVDESGADGRDNGGSAGRDEVLVSAGGGAMGERLLATAIEAKPLSSLASAPWRLLVGAAAAPEIFDSLTARAATQQGIQVERARGDFPQMLRRCRLSISQGGYNTMMETIQAGCRALAVPYAGGTETEQTLRGQLLAERGAINLLAEAALSPARLAAEIDRVMAKPSPALRPALDMDGGLRTARLLDEWQRTIPWQ